MPHASVNGIQLWFDTYGEHDGEPLVLVSGLGSQAIRWEPAFVDGLCDRGFFVIRMDNRDVGLSTKIEWSGGPVLELLARIYGGETVEVPYRLSDMAADVVGLLDHLGIESTHVLGMSMGGMIAQTMAIEHPRRVRTLASLMSTTGDRDVGFPSAEANATLVSRPPDDREGAIEHAVRTQRIIGTPDQFDEEKARARAAANYDRCFCPSGVGRQLLAVAGSGARSEALRSVQIPTLVLHGTLDPLVDVSGGVRTAEVIPGAELLLLEGMGHDLPDAYWAQVIDGITRLAARYHEEREQRDKETTAS